METKKCCKCKQVKPIEEFYPNKENFGTRTSNNCRPCANEYAKARYDKIKKDKMFSII